MSVSWIKTSVTAGLTLAASFFHTAPAQAGPFGRAVVGHIMNNSPRAQMIAGTVAPIVQTAQAQGGRLSPGQIVQAVSDGRNLVQNLRASSGPSFGGGAPVEQFPVDPGFPQDFAPAAPACFPGMGPQDMGPVDQASFTGPLPQDPGPQGPMSQDPGPQGPGPGPQGPGSQGPMPQGPMGMAPVDLLVENITLAAPATKVAGPAYKITVRNQGSEASAKFNIALFASLDGKVNEQCPKAFIEVRDLAPVSYTHLTLPTTERV